MGDYLKTDAGSCCEFVGEDVVSEKHFRKGAGIAVRKGETELKDMLNKAIKAIRDNGTYEKINAKYFPFSIY